jgi:hypothetical protein
MVTFFGGRLKRFLEKSGKFDGYDLLSRFGKGD